MPGQRFKWAGVGVYVCLGCMDAISRQAVFESSGRALLLDFPLIYFLMYPDFSCSKTVPVVKPLSLNQLRSRNLALIVRDIPVRHLVETRQLGGSRILVIRDGTLFKSLSDSPDLARGRSHEYVRKIFGEHTVFMLPGGDKHQQKKAELKGGLSKARINAMVPNIAAEAAAAIDSMLAHSSEPVDMEVDVLRYLFHVAGRALTGTSVHLDAHVRTFQVNMATILSSASSTLETALSSVSSTLGHLLSRPARNAVGGMFDIGRKLLLEACNNPRDNLATDMLRRHGIDPKQVDDKTRFSSELLHDISMIFAASIFTTSNLVLGVIHHFGRHPDELQELRGLMQKDFPGGVRNLAQLVVNPSVRKLWPIMVGQSSVDLVVRDVVADGGFEDRDGVRYEMRKGDLVVFDLASSQKLLMDGLGDRLKALPEASRFLDFLDARHNDVNLMFFGGANQCPGRNLMAADGVLFLLELLQRVDMTPEKQDFPMTPGLVNTFQGSTWMTVRSPVDPAYELHQQLLGSPPPPAKADPAEPLEPSHFSRCPFKPQSQLLSHPLNR